MAANEVIFFPFWAQLSPRMAFPDFPHLRRLLSPLLAEIC
jgi:hypothetical protein